jgi:hypothetical protein
MQSKDFFYALAPKGGFQLQFVEERAIRKDG